MSSFINQNPCVLLSSLLLYLHILHALRHILWLQIVVLYKSEENGKKSLYMWDTDVIFPTYFWSMDETMNMEHSAMESWWYIPLQEMNLHGILKIQMIAVKRGNEFAEVEHKQYQIRWQLIIRELYTTREDLPWVRH